jgi:DNA repair protein RadC
MKTKFRVAAPEDALKTISPRYKDVISLGQEALGVIALNNKNNVLGTDLVFKGTGNECNVTPSIILRWLLRKPSCVRFICVHNHPGGCVKPSTEDTRVLQRMAAAGLLVGLDLLDFIIFYKNSKVYYSAQADAQIERLRNEFKSPNKISYTLKVAEGRQ